MVLGARHTENGSYENSTLEMVCSGLPHGEWFSRTYYTGTGFYGLATQKMALKSVVSRHVVDLKSELFLIGNQ